MNADIKTKWVAALRSGEYAQGTDNLRDSENRFCCLGVLCDLFAKSMGVPFSHELQTEDAALPVRAVRVWSGLESIDPNLVIEGDSDSASVHNDAGKTFAQIADAIEEQL